MHNYHISTLFSDFKEPTLNKKQTLFLKVNILTTVLGHIKIQNILHLIKQIILLLIKKTNPSTKTMEDYWTKLNKNYLKKNYNYLTKNFKQKYQPSLTGVCYKVNFIL